MTTKRGTDKRRSASTIPPRTHRQPTAPGPSSGTITTPTGRGGGTGGRRADPESVGTQSAGTRAREASPSVIVASWLQANGDTVAPSGRAPSEVRVTQHTAASAMLPPPRGDVDRPEPGKPLTRHPGGLAASPTPRDSDTRPSGRPSAPTSATRGSTGWSRRYLVLALAAGAVGYIAYTSPSGPTGVAGTGAEATNTTNHSPNDRGANAPATARAPQAPGSTSAPESAPTSRTAAPHAAPTDPFPKASEVAVEAPSAPSGAGSGAPHDSRAAASAVVETSPKDSLPSPAAPAAPHPAELPVARAGVSPSPTPSSPAEAPTPRADRPAPVLHRAAAPAEVEPRPRRAARPGSAYDHVPPATALRKAAREAYERQYDAVPPRRGGAPSQAAD